MKYCKNINFPALTFTSPGIYSYTVKELTPSNERWETDDRVYSVTVTVVDIGGGNLSASVDYPDGFPKFVNIYDGQPPKPPHNPCKYFKCLPFPMFIFAPPQKPEYMELMKKMPQVFEWWDDLLKQLGNGYGRD